MPNLSSSSCHELGHFKHFYSVKDHVGHYYLDEMGQLLLSKGMLFSFIFASFTMKNNVFVHGGV